MTDKSQGSQGSQGSRICLVQCSNDDKIEGINIYVKNTQYANKHGYNYVRSNDMHQVNVLNMLSSALHNYDYVVFIGPFDMIHNIDLKLEDLITFVFDQPGKSVAIASPLQFSDRIVCIDPRQCSKANEIALNYRPMMFKNNSTTFKIMEEWSAIINLPKSVACINSMCIGELTSKFDTAIFNVDNLNIIQGQGVSSICTKCKDTIETFTNENTSNQRLICTICALLLLAILVMVFKRNI